LPPHEYVPSVRICTIPFFHTLATCLSLALFSYPAAYTSLPDTKTEFAQASFEPSVSTCDAPFFQIVATGLLPTNSYPAIYTSGFRTVTVQVAVLLLTEVTVIMAVPSARAVTVPPLTVATTGALLLHVSVLSAASLGDTVAVRVAVSPATSVGVVWLSVTPVAVTDSGTSSLHEAAVTANAAIVSMFAVNLDNFIFFICLYF
jgi:hypothetical protein